MASFSSLPWELRDRIYRCALTTDREIILEPSKVGPYVSPSPEKPLSITLLGVSKAIHDEAASVLYGNNRFCLPIRLPTSKIPFFVKYGSLFKDIRVRCCMGTSLECMYEAPATLQAPEPRMGETSGEEQLEAPYADASHRKYLLAQFTNLRTIKFDVCLDEPVPGTDGILTEHSFSYRKTARLLMTTLKSKTPSRELQLHHRGVAMGKFLSTP